MKQHTPVFFLGGMEHQAFQVFLDNMASDNEHLQHIPNEPANHILS